MFNKNLTQSVIKFSKTCQTQLRTHGHQWFRAALILSFLASLLLNAMPTYASSVHDPGEPEKKTETRLSGAGDKLSAVFNNILKVFIQVCMGVIAGLFVASLMRGAMVAQANNLVGNANGVSRAWMDIISAIVVAAFAVLVPVIAGVVMDALRDSFKDAMANPIPSW
jgi:uncharacterized membrane protein YraQ (UPF0718 family)